MLYSTLQWCGEAPPPQEKIITAYLTPAHRFTHSVYERRACSSTQKQNNKDAIEDNKILCLAKLWKNLFLHCLPSDPNIRKEWMNFIFNEAPDCITNSVFCSLHFTADLFTNKAHFDVGFSERLKLKDNAVPTILQTHTSQS